MRIVVTHVTRMGAPRICIAGIDLDTYRHVRPTTPPTSPITRGLLREEGGFFSFGALVDLGPVTPRPVRPESEDHEFEIDRAGHLRDLTGDELLVVLDKVSSASLEAGFGPHLERVGKWKHAVEAGCGDRSLAVVRAHRRPVLEVDDQYGPRLQLRFNDLDPPTYLPVTDVRLFEPDQKTIRQAAVDDAAHRLRQGVEAYLMLGLARAYRADSDDRERHWLQLNGLVLADRPVGDRP